ncbi:hypothetical protein LA06_01260 [Xanthomonas oryzae pv. oryzae]|nr:hypothetical protein LA06_01260 [Xanthomonas oryzae pv. oryzae]
MDPVATVLSALSAAPRQQERLLRLHTPLGPDVLVAETLDGRESVDGGGFRFDVGALSANAGLPLDDLLGRNQSFSMTLRCLGNTGRISFTINDTPCTCATAAKTWMSVTFRGALPIDSTNTAVVRSFSTVDHRSGA